MCQYKVGLVSPPGLLNVVKHCTVKMCTLTVVSVPRYILSLCGVSVSRYICFFLCQDPYSDTITACCFIVRIYTK